MGLWRKSRQICFGFDQILGMIDIEKRIKRFGVPDRSGASMAGHEHIHFAQMLRNQSLAQGMAQRDRPQAEGGMPLLA
jgi:hypothetical protein